MNSKLAKVLELARRVGGHCFVLDQDSQPLVILGLAEYEKLLNREATGLDEEWTAAWTEPAGNQVATGAAEELTVSADLTRQSQPAAEETAPAEQFYFEPVEG